MYILVTINKANFRITVVENLTIRQLDVSRSGVGGICVSLDMDVISFSLRVYPHCKVDIMLMSN